MTGKGGPYINDKEEGIPIGPGRVSGPTMQYDASEKVSIDPFAQAVSALRDIFESGDKTTRSATLANINAFQFCTSIINRCKELESRLGVIEEVFKSNVPAEGIEERRKSWPAIQKALTKQK